MDRETVNIIREEINRTTRELAKEPLGKTYSVEDVMYELLTLARRIDQLEEEYLEKMEKDYEEDQWKKDVGFHDIFGHLSLPKKPKKE